ncbi:MAG: hypothetical protein Q4D88_05930 [Anaerococcus sp.]|nr:hypothetical protein [Anaerococcus sp.]
MYQDFKDIYDIYSVSSDESEIKKYLAKKYENLGYLTFEDRLNSIFLNKENKGKPKLMIGFPLDEIGLMIENIEEDGKIRFIFLEDLSPLSFINQRVNIKTRDNGNIKGVVCLDRKFIENKSSNFDGKDLYIKAFLDDDDLFEKVNIGDLVSLDTDILEDENFLTGKALSQKIFSYLSIDLARIIKERSYGFDLYIGGISHSTIGFRGSQTSAHLIKPDFSINLSGFEVNNSSPKINLGDGAIISYFDSKMLPDQKFLSFIKNNFKLKPYIGLRENDGSFVHKTLKGAASISMGLPIKNMYTGNELIFKNDYKELKEVILQILDDFDKFIGSYYGFD